MEKDYSKEIKLVEVIIGVCVESWDEDYSTGYIYHTERYMEIEFYELIEVKVLEDEPHDHEINFEHLTSLDEYVKKYDYNNEYVEEDGYNEIKKELYAVEIGGKWYVY